MNKRIGLVAAFITTFALTACGVSSTDSSSMGSAVMPMPGAEIAMDNKMATVTDIRAVIKTASLGVRVKDIQKAVDEATSIAKEFNGQVDDSSIYKNPGTNEINGANLTIRVPSDQLEQTVEKLRQIGDVENYSLSGSDVTMQKVDLEARISSLKTSISRFKELIASATNASDLIAAESALAERQAELDSLNAQMKYLSQQVEMSAIYMSMYLPEYLNTLKPIGFIQGLEKGFYAMLNFIINLTSILGLVLPWVLFLALLVAIYKIVQKVRRR